MFEDSLVESAGRIRIHARRYLAGSLLAEAALLSLLILLPYFFPEALPRKFLRIPLLAPPPPAAPILPAHTAVTSGSATELLGASLAAPTRIPHSWPTVIDTAPPGIGNPLPSDFGDTHGVTPLSGLGRVPPPPTPRVRTVQRGNPIRVSEGVAAGQLIVPIRPEYPVIAREAGVQGTVLVDAIIGKDGRIARLRVLGGPPLLVNTAVSAIQRARYRPWTLNGQPVEVETTIRVVFSLGNA
jgi:periplasmic protein TonB